MGEPDETLSSKVARAAGWMVGARFFIRLISLLSIFVLARLLSPTDFGVAAAAFAMLMIAQGVSDLQLGAALVRARTIADHDWDAAFTLNIARGLILAAAIAALAAPLADLLDAPDAFWALTAMALMPLIEGASNPRFALFARALSLRQEFILSVGVQAIGVVVTVAAALILRDYWALILGSLVSSASRVGLSYVMISYRPRLGLRGARALIRFGGWLTGARALNVINDQSDQFFVLARLDAAALGVYRVGQSIVMMPTTELIQPLTQGLFPAFSSIQDDPGRMRRAYLNAQQAVLLIALPIGVGLPFIADPLVFLALGAQWADAALVVQFLAPVLAVQTIGAGIDALIMAQGGTRALFVRAAIFAAIRIPIMLIGVLSGGLIGLLIARVITGLINVVINLFMLRSAIGLRPIEALSRNARAWTAAALTAAALGAQLWLDPPGAGDPTVREALWRIAAAVTLGATVYVGVVLALWRRAGLPDGAERRLLDVAAHLAARVRAKLARPHPTGGSA